MAHGDTLGFRGSDGILKHRLYPFSYSFQRELNLGYEMLFWGTLNSRLVSNESAQSIRNTAEELFTPRSMCDN